MWKIGQASKKGKIRAYFQFSGLPSFIDFKRQIIWAGKKGKKNAEADQSSTND